jgi:translation elongation factor EF-G
MSETEKTPAEVAKPSKKEKAEPKTLAELQQELKKLAAAPSGQAVVATYLGGEDERTEEQKEAGEKATVDDHKGRPLMGVLFPKGKEVCVVGDVIVRKLASLALGNVFEVRIATREEALEAEAAEALRRAQARHGRPAQEGPRG